MCTMPLQQGKNQTIKLCDFDCFCQILLLCLLGVNFLTTFSFYLHHVAYTQNLVVTNFVTCFSPGFGKVQYSL